MSNKLVGTKINIMQKLTVACLTKWCKLHAKFMGNCYLVGA